MTPRIRSDVDVPASHGAGSGNGQEGDARYATVRKTVRGGVPKGSAAPDVSDLSRPPRGCCLALALSCLLWACAALWLAWRSGWRP
jgi:hypothetical protein